MPLLKGYARIRYGLMNINTLKNPHRTFVALSDLKNNQLRALALRTGINSSGTKAVLNACLERDLLIPRLVPKKHNRILSIDMGIRNLAYAVLDVPCLALENNSDRHPQSIKLHAWSRISVTPTISPDLKETFDPATFAIIAYDLVTKTLLPYNPTQILIERQRYRSGGAPTVQEWTVRVNMFESMLHAVLRTLQREGDMHQREEGRQFPVVNSVSPQKVARFYFADDQQNGEGDQKQKKIGKIEKAMKISIAQDFLREKLEISDSVRSIRDAFLRTKGDKLGTVKASDVINEEEELKNLGNQDVSPRKQKLKKLDDLADCLLQGLAWVQWEINRLSIIEANTD